MQRNVCNCLWGTYFCFRSRGVTEVNVPELHVSSDGVGLEAALRKAVNARILLRRESTIFSVHFKNSAPFWFVV